MCSGHCGGTGFYLFLELLIDEDIVQRGSFRGNLLSENGEESPEL